MQTIDPIDEQIADAKRKIAGLKEIRANWLVGVTSNPFVIRVEGMYLGPDRNDNNKSRLVSRNSAYRLDRETAEAVAVRVRETWGECSIVGHRKALDLDIEDAENVLELLEMIR